MRTAPPDVLVQDGAQHEHVPIRNRAQSVEPPADEQVAIDCLQLIRFGLRAAADPKMAASIQAIDALLMTETPRGRVWHRYTGDGYGEHPDGAPFNGWGVGRGWPLLTGERGHVALVSGEAVEPYLLAMTRMTGAGGLLPEQVWDAAPIPERGLWPGRPSGAAMPLVWAHAEFIKLALSLVAGAPVDRPPRTWTRYQGGKPPLDFALWLPRQRLNRVMAGQELRILLPEPAEVHWGTDGWSHRADVPTEDWGLGHVARLPTSGLPAGVAIDFTFYWPGRGQWQGEDFRVTVSDFSSAR
jgi:glucoamylase